MKNEYSLLYVEDDPGSRKVMQGLVQTLPYPVHLTIFSDSTNFLSRFHALHSQPDVILLDINVQPYNGFEMLGMLRRNKLAASAMVVALTASVMNEEVRKLKHAGFDGILAKPLKFHEFSDRMTRILAGEHQWTVIR